MRQEVCHIRTSYLGDNSETRVFARHRCKIHSSRLQHHHGKPDFVRELPPAPTQGGQCLIPKASLSCNRSAVSAHHTWPTLPGLWLQRHHRFLERQTWTLLHTGCWRGFSGRVCGRVHQKPVPCNNQESELYLYTWIDCFHELPTSTNRPGLVKRRQATLNPGGWRPTAHTDQVGIRPNTLPTRKRTGWYLDKGAWHAFWLRTGRAEKFTEARCSTLETKLMSCDSTIHQEGATEWGGRSCGHTYLITLCTWVLGRHYPLLNCGDRKSTRLNSSHWE